jgi:TIR domain
LNSPRANARLTSKAASDDDRKAESAVDVIHDAAISFLAADEGIAGAIASALEASGLNVFFFPKKQEELAGSDGLDSMREPFLKARVAVALYREPWGKTKWTRIEETAIKDRCLEIGWQSLQFVMLDKKKAHPKWLPNTHIRYNYEDYGRSSTMLVLIRTAIAT